MKPDPQYIISLTNATMYFYTDFSSKIPASLKIKILQEKIPKSYDNLRRRIEVLAEEARLKKKSPVMHKQEFWWVCGSVGLWVCVWEGVGGWVWVHSEFSCIAVYVMTCYVPCSNKMNDIINGVEETEIAVDFLHTTSKIHCLQDYMKSHSFSKNREKQKCGLSDTSFLSCSWYGAPLQDTSPH